MCHSNFTHLGSSHSLMAKQQQQEPLVLTLVAHPLAQMVLVELLALPAQGLRVAAVVSAQVALQVAKLVMGWVMALLGLDLDWQMVMVMETAMVGQGWGWVILMVMG
jgi:hypothetical protein